MHGLLMVSSACTVSSCKLISVCAHVLALSTNPEKKKDGLLTQYFAFHLTMRFSWPLILK